MGKFEPGQSKVPGSGRRKGVSNIVTGDIRALVLGALDELGGQRYLVQQAKKNPQAFLSLLGKCLPKDIRIDAKLSLADILREAEANFTRSSQGEHATTAGSGEKVKP